MNTTYNQNWCGNCQKSCHQKATSCNSCGKRTTVRCINMQMPECFLEPGMKPEDYEGKFVLVPDKNTGTPRLFYAGHSGEDCDGTRKWQHYGYGMAGAIQGFMPVGTGVMPIRIDVLENCEISIVYSDDCVDFNITSTELSDAVKDKIDEATKTYQTSITTLQAKVVELQECKDDMRTQIDAMQSIQDQLENVVADLVQRVGALGG